MNISKPIIYEVDYNKTTVDDLRDEVQNKFNENDSSFLLNYPVVYIIHDEKTSNFSVYIGETSDIIKRTNQHLLADLDKKPFWKEFANSKTSKMYFIGQEHFNKSLTLDVENRFMHYLSSVPSVKHIYNARTNEQRDYYTSSELDGIYSEIWDDLHSKNEELFPSEQSIKDSAIYKASPFHKLSEEQANANYLIESKIFDNIRNNNSKLGNLILVTGEAGTGKTVLMSNLFYDLWKQDEEKFNTYLLVNHDQQVKVYEEIADKLGINDKKNKYVMKPTTFIEHTTGIKDVIIVDEAHLLLTQRNQAYHSFGENQLEDLRKRAKVVVAVLDFKQVLKTTQIIMSQNYNNLLKETAELGNHIDLDMQFRMNADKTTINWIRSFVDDGIIKNIPQSDSKGYRIVNFDSPGRLQYAIEEKATDVKNGLSRMIATFDWEYVDKRRPKNSKTWDVKIGNWSMPWNLQLPVKKGEKKLPWAEQSQTIKEVGSTFSIQGFDLNYAGVIIGPSVKYRNGRIIFDKAASKNKKATQKRGKDEYFDQYLLRNELNVLLTRGANGLFIYAVDDELREMLMKAQRGEL